MKKTRLNPISDKRYTQMDEEYNIRLKLIARCGGNPPNFTGLHPHEKVFRSRGGKLSLENSKMLCDKCHAPKHGERIVE